MRLLLNLFLCLGFALLSAPSVLAMDLVTANKTAELPVAAPRIARSCANKIWVVSLQNRSLLQFDGARFNLEKETPWSSLRVSGEVVAMTCRPGELLIASEQNLYRIGLTETGALNASGAQTLSTPGKGLIRDLNCTSNGCTLVRDTIYKSKDLSHWQVSPLKLSSEISNVQQKLKDENPFVDWQEQFIITSGQYSRARLTPNDTLIALDPLRSSVVISNSKETFKWGAWGAWESRLMYPKGFSVTDSFVAVSDTGTKGVFFFTTGGQYIGTLANDKNWVRFDYPVDLSLSSDVLLVTDFNANTVSVFRLPKDLGAGFKPFHQVDNIARENLFREAYDPYKSAETRCLSCHDGTIVNSLHFFLPGTTHHSIGAASVKSKTKLPLEDGKTVSCFSCHDGHHTSRKGVVIDAKGNSHAVAKAPGMLRMDVPALCLECHQDRNEPNKNHFGMKHNGITVASCLQCHAMHLGANKTKELKESVPALCVTCHGKKQIPQNHPMSEKVNCISCHSLHESNKAITFAAQKKENPGFTCITCHKDVRDFLTKSVHLTKVKITKKVQWNEAELRCVECHNPHAAKRGPIANLCLSCHKDRKQSHAALIVTAETARASGIHLEDTHVSCITCHSAHHGVRDKDQVMVFCSTCHGTKTAALFDNYHHRNKVAGLVEHAQ